MADFLFGYLLGSFSVAAVATVALAARAQRKPEPMPGQVWELPGGAQVRVIGYGHHRVNDVLVEPVGGGLRSWLDPDRLRREGRLVERYEPVGAP